MQFFGEGGGGVQLLNVILNGVRGEVKSQQILHHF